jgi:hypothetical protein
MVAAVGLTVLARSGGSRCRKGLGLGLLAPYVAHRVASEPLGRPRQWPLVIPQALVLDLAEVGVLAVASARHRTLLL